MDDEQVAQFTGITAATTAQAEQYLRLTEGNLEQAVQLFFEDPNLASFQAPSAPAATQTQPASSSRPKRKAYTEDADGVVHVDSDDEEDFEMSDVPDEADDLRPDMTADEEMARRLQEEMYSGGRADPESVRAPMARTTETLVGGPPGFDDADITHMVQQQILGRQQRRTTTRPGIFNQRDTQAAIWEDTSVDPQEHARNLALATGGASTRSSKSSTLAEMFRPPFEIISRLPFEEAREQGKDEEKWLLVNVQDASIFDCQVLNRDLWKKKEIVDIVKENFIFLQYAQDDPKGMGYIQYYFQDLLHNQSAYPHIAIVDPRTGEQVKVWSGPPIPPANEFLMQLYEFLDRYSLNADAKNPVAKRKPTTKAAPLESMTEEQMLEMALQNSLANDASDSGPAHEDPDELTKSVNLGKGKERATDDSTSEDPSLSSSNTVTFPSPFALIPSTRPHTEPANDPATTTRIQFRYSGGRVVRRFTLQDPVQRIYEWLKAEPFEGKQGVDFELMFMGKNLMELLDETIEGAKLKNGSVMVEFTGTEDE